MSVDSRSSGEVITFYSYKGGTGRSMALANAACLLAQSQRDPRGVLMIDWDLEAPGLHRYFESRMASDDAPGLIDLLCELRDAAFANESDAFFDRFDAALDKCALRIETPFPLRLIRSGRSDGDYATRIATFDWEAMFRKDPTVFARLSGELTRRYRYVLIDSRTGVTDASGICSMLMPEKLVLVFTPNRQSLDGVLDIARRSIEFRKRSEDLRPLIIFPLASRIESGDGVQRTTWRAGGIALSGANVIGYQPQFERLIDEIYGLEHCSLGGYFDDVQVPHDRSFAYGERVAVLESVTQDKFSIADGYRHLVRYLERDEPPWSTAQESFDVLLSYDKADLAEIRQLEQQLRSHGLNPWLDEAHLPLGASWDTEIEHALRSSGMVAICVADATLSSLQDRVVTLARRYSKPIIPVVLARYRGDSLPETIAALRGVDLRDTEARPVETLIRGITGLVASPSARAARSEAYSIEKTGILGHFEKALASSVALRDRLVAAAELHYAFCFDPISESEISLDYEPRCSTSCKGCRSIWVASEAGEIVCMRLGSAELETRKTRLDCGVRTLAHLHGLGFLIAGLDDGHLVVLRDDFAENACLHLEEWFERSGKRPAPYEPRPLVDDTPGHARYGQGITAVLELPTNDPRVVDIVVATRYPALFVVEVRQDDLAIRARHVLPGWVGWMMTVGRPGAEVLVCVTRGGEILEWPCQVLRDDSQAAPLCTDTNLLPITVGTASRWMQGDKSSVLIGATDGLYVRHAGEARPARAVTTRTAVLSVAALQMAREDSGATVRIVLGLDDGRLRVIEWTALHGGLDDDNALQPHDFAIYLSNAVLAVETLAADDATSCFVLAALRDGRMRLFRVRSPSVLRSEIRALWRDVIEGSDVTAASTLDALLDSERQLRHSVAATSEDALRYLLVDTILPRWTTALGARDWRIVARACAVASNASPKVLHRLSATMGELAHGDADALIQLSMGCLVAMPSRDTQRWLTFVSHHLKQLHACARRLVDHRDVSRLQHWERFLRKYLLRGDTFAVQRHDLESLVQRHAAMHRYLDALIYAAQLERQRHDLKWSRIAYRDDNGRAQGIVGVDLIDDIAIAVTTSARVVVFDATGNQMPIFDGERALDCLVPPVGDRSSASVRTRAARVVRRQGPWVRVALSWAGAQTLDREQLRVAIFDLRLGKDRVDLAGVHVARPPGYSRARGTDLEVHGLAGIAGTDAFLAGLDSSESPLALLALRPDEGHQWILSPLDLSPARDVSPTQLSTPTRAVAVAALDTPGEYLAAAGSAGGALRFAVFDLDGNVLAVGAEPTLLAYPINGIALTIRTDDHEHGHACYVGSETGVSSCWLVGIVRKEPGIGNIVTEQLWLDVHRGPVVAVRPWVPSTETPLYDEPVTFVATETGSVSIYRAARGSPISARLSDAWNYYFEGMRFDRIALPAGLTAWAIRRGCAAFLAGYPDGTLLFGKFHGPGESAPRAVVRRSLEEVYGRVMLAHVVFGAGADEVHKLAALAMIRGGHGALRGYVLRKQLERVPWNELGEREVDALLLERVDDLDAEIPEELEQLKIVVKTVSAKVLDRHPDDILEDCRPGRNYDIIAAYPRVLRTYQYLIRYILDRGTPARPGVIRMRMIIMTALLRANVFRHIALDQQSGQHLSLMLREVLNTNLRNDDPIVRAEALRAVAVVLRNIAVLFERADNDRHRHALRTSFFPQGLETIQWLVNTILENQARNWRRGEDALLPTEWSYATVLVSIFRLFPGDSLGLCEQISRWGLGGSLEIIANRLHGERVGTLERRIRDLYIVPSLRQPSHARVDFISTFGDCNVSEMLVTLDIAPADTDYVRAGELLHAYRQLALLWMVNRDEDLQDIPVRWRHVDDIHTMTGGLSRTIDLLNGFVEIARAPRQTRTTRLAELRGQIGNEPHDDQRLLTSVRLVFERVVEHWSVVLESSLPTTGEKVAGYTLGSMLMERGNGLIYAIEGDRQRVLKVLRDPLDVAQRQEFNRNVRLSRELAERYPAYFVGVQLLEPTLGYAVMGRVDATAKSLGALRPGERSATARIAAAQLTRALRYLHAEGLAHGDLRADNIFVNRDQQDSTFRLGDLQVAGDATYSRAALAIPGFLRKAVPAEVRHDHWIDLVSLSLFLHWVLTGDTLSPHADEVTVNALAASLKARGEDDSDVAAHAIAFVLGRPPGITAEQLEWLVFPGMPPKLDRKPLARRPLVRFDVFLSYDAQDIAVARGLYTHLIARGLVPYLDEREAVSERWRVDLRGAMDESRSFAILVGDSFRDDGVQAKEIRVARMDAKQHGLPLLVFLLGTHLPGDFIGDEVMSIGSDTTAIADRIVRCFQHPIARLGPEASGSKRRPS